MQSLAKGVWPRSMSAPLAVGALMGILPFLAACYGYGSYLRYTWILVLPFVVVVGIAVQRTWRMVHSVYVRLRGNSQSETESGPWPRIEKQIRKWRASLLTLVFCTVFFFAAWFAGSQARKAYCRRICRACDPILAALGEYRRQNGSYPLRLEHLPDFEALRTAADISVRQGEFRKSGIDLGGLDEADATFYLSPQGCLALVPIERMLILSITRFSAYLKRPGAGAWTLDRILWMLTSM